MVIASKPMAKATSPRAGSSADAAVPLLVDRFGPKLYALALRLCGNPSDAEDMVQEIFLQAYRKWHTFQGKADAGTWLYAIAARACRSRTRRKGGTDRRMPAVSQLMPWNDRGVIDLAGPADAPEARLIEQESVTAVHGAIVDLPRPFRVPLILKDMLEMPIEEVAKALNLRPPTVKTRVHRARLMLRKALLARKGVPKRPAPDPMYDKQVCLDLLHAKLDAMDRGGAFPIEQKIVCDRCRAVFAELDLAQDACARLAKGEFPSELRGRILSKFGARG
ncbi:MAG: RNA polymerase sigma factor [Phycisphaerales bacterium]|nr:RNA polymerase sigma factor [Planctomycetota bacterium]